MSRLNEHETDWNDPAFDALMDEVLSMQSLSPDELAQLPGVADRVLAATAQHFSLPEDRVLDPLLDEALCVGDACPTDLSSRILKATLPELPEPMLVMPVRRETNWRRWAIAAAVAIASSAFWFSIGSGLQKAQKNEELAALASHVDETTAQAVALIGYRNEPPHPVDDEIVRARQAAARIQGSLASSNDWQDAYVALDQTLRDEFDPGL